MIRNLFLSILIVGMMTLNVSAIEPTADIKVEKLIQDSNSWDHKMLPAYPNGEPEVTILKITIPAGAKLPLHHHPVINAGVLLSGELTVFAADGKTNTLKAGDALIELVNTEHYGQNTGDTDAQIIVFYAGIKGEPITVKNE